MPTSLVQKLRIKPGYSLLTLNAPATFSQTLGELPPQVNIGTKLKSYHQIHWFVANKAALEKDITKVLKWVTTEKLCWVYYPKVSSGMQTDLTRDKGWETLLQHAELQWLSLISFNSTWSVFGFRLKTVDDKKKAVNAKPREIFNWVNPTNKTILLPDDLKKAMAKSKLAATFFETLSFTNKKEYVEWIVTAKRPETRLERINGTIERLEKGWKNPRNL